MKYRNVNNSRVEVEYLGAVEVRLAETKWQGALYVRNGKRYVRMATEFAASFIPVKEEAHESK